MSVAALSSKRDFEAFLEGPVSPTLSSPTCRAASALKRSRCAPPQRQFVAPPQQLPYYDEANDQNGTALCRDMGSGFPAPIAKKGRFHYSVHVSTPSTSEFQRLPSPPRENNEPLFTYEQVRDIVRNAVEEKDSQLRAMYDGLLQEKLQEQFAAFFSFQSRSHSSHGAVQQP